MSLLPMLGGLTAGRVELPPRQRFDQRDVNCCVSCAIATALEAGDPASPALAPLYHFFFAGGPGVVELGLSVSQARQSLFRNGISEHALHDFPISRSSVDRRPSDRAVADGVRRRPIHRDSGNPLWQALPTVVAELSWKHQLNSGRAVVFLFRPSADYFGLTRQRPTLGQNLPSQGDIGHAAVVIGYDDSESVFIVQDSRGSGFGIDGQWFLPYSLCESPFLVFAFAFAVAPD